MALKNSSTKFWRNFAKSHWEKKPILARNFSSSVQKMDEAQIFSMLVAYSDYCRKLNDPAGFKFYVDGQRQNDAEILQILPLKKDKTLLNYHLRMEKIFNDYCLVCDELLQTSQKNWENLKAFTENLFDHVGFPYRFVEMGLYLGNYRQTPFGVHVDGCGVFSFPVVGKKVFRLWKPEFAEKHPELDRADEYDRFKKYSQIMKAGPGDMTYWPSSAWHIAESNGSFSATWSLGVWVDQTHLQTIEKAFQPLLKSKLGKLSKQNTLLCSLSAANGQVQKLPADYLQSLTAIGKMSSNELYDAFLRSWLALRSMDGFKNSPCKKSKTKLSLKSRIQINPSQKILWSHLKSDKSTLFAFQSQLVESLPSSHLFKVIQALNLGQVCLLSDYLSEDSKNSELKSLQLLSDAGAFRAL